MIILAAVAVSFISCSSGNSRSGATTTADSQVVKPAPAYDHSLATGSVTDSVICKNQLGNSYALYLPTYYSPDRKFPCIYFFDPHGHGGIPVSAYKDLAEKYGFVLVGSNNSKNGTPWQVTNESVKTLMEDTRTRINIDPQRIYTSGFSGGSRVASSIAILDGGVTGVIGCAIGFPAVERPFQNKFDYFGIVGDYDFNFSDMEQLDNALEQNGFAHQLITFNGKHEWPPASEFKTGLLWIQVNAMKENRQPKNDTLVNTLKSDYDKRISGAVSSGDLIKVHELLNGIIKVLDRLTDVSSYRKQLSDLTADAGFKDAVATHGQLQQTELGRQQELAKQFTQQDGKWWGGKIAAMNQTVHSAKTKQESQMNQRLLNYLGFVSYIYSNQALKVGDLNNAAAYLKVFKMADPANPDCSYLYAVYYMDKGDALQAMSALKDAVKSGYNDVSQLVTDPAFGSLQNEPEFKKIVTEVKGNYKSK